MNDEPTSLIVEIDGRPWTLLFDVRGHGRHERAHNLAVQLRPYLPAGAEVRSTTFGPKDDPTRTVRTITSATPSQAQAAFSAMDEAARKRETVPTDLARLALIPSLS